MFLLICLVGMFVGVVVVIFVFIGIMFYCIFDCQIECLQQGEVDVCFNMVLWMFDYFDLVECWLYLQGKLDNLSQEYELICFWIDSDDLCYYYGCFSELVQWLIVDGVGCYELELLEYWYVLIVWVGVLLVCEGWLWLIYVIVIDSVVFYEVWIFILKWLFGLFVFGVLLVLLFGYWIVCLGLWLVYWLFEEVWWISLWQLLQCLQFLLLLVELCELVGVFNSVLDCLEQVYVCLELFNVDVVYELCMLLINLIGQIQVVLFCECSGEYYEEVL